MTSGFEPATLRLAAVRVLASVVFIYLMKRVYTMCIFLRWSETEAGT
jgi:hypothetical protein